MRPCHHRIPPACGADDRSETRVQRQSTRPWRWLSGRSSSIRIESAPCRGRSAGWNTPSEGRDHFDRIGTTQRSDARIALVAQLDRVLPSEGRGRRFESCQARQINGLRLCWLRPADDKAKEKPSSTIASAATVQAVSQSCAIALYFRVCAALGQGRWGTRCSDHSGRVGATEIQSPPLRRARNLRHHLPERCRGGLMRGTSSPGAMRQNPVASARPLK